MTIIRKQKYIMLLIAYLYTKDSDKKTTKLYAIYIFVTFVLAYSTNWLRLHFAVKKKKTLYIFRNSDIETQLRCFPYGGYMEPPCEEVVF